jgi:hypothetical protein
MWPLNKFRVGKSGDGYVIVLGRTESVEVYFSQLKHDLGFSPWVMDIKTAKVYDTKAEAVYLMKILEAEAI